MIPEHLSPRFKGFAHGPERQVTRGQTLQIAPGPWRLASAVSGLAFLLAIFAGSVWAFESYDGCETCHGVFMGGGNYISLQDGTDWGGSLMAEHVTFVGRECEACHSGPGSTVNLNSSSNSTFSKSCVGCHGRDEDVTGNCVGGGGVAAECGSGAGLRKYHESNVGANTCSSCHTSDPTPVGEHILPYNFGLDGIVIMDSCDGDGTESQYGATGLDNDGDGTRDASDSDCETQANSPPTQPGVLSASLLTASSAAVQWGASEDSDGDPISYQVEYRSNGVTPWSDGGITSNTSQALDDLDAEQSYDVQVTPNDGMGDGPIRSAQNLFQTLPVSEITPINPGLNGSWWGGPDRAGEGAQFEVSDGGDGSLIVVATVYSYDTMGNQIFMISVGIANGNTVEVEVFITEGGLWGDVFDPMLVLETQWGSGTFTVISCELLHMELNPNAEYQALGYTDLAYDLIRLTVSVLPCPIDN